MVYRMAERDGNESAHTIIEWKIGGSVNYKSVRHCRHTGGAADTIAHNLHVALIICYVCVTVWFCNNK
jgi:hypothetical protein